MINHEIPIDKIPENDLIRLKKLHQYEIMDTSPEEDFDTIALLASSLFETDNAHISFLDESNVFFKANLDQNIGSKISREGSLYELSILEKEAKVFYEAAQLAGNTRFYAAAPIITSDGYAIGAIGVTDSKPHELVTASQLNMLQMLSKLVMEKLEKRLANIIAIRTYDERLRRLAHDIKNPVTSISLYAQLLGSREMNADKVFSMAAKIEVSTKRIEEKLNNLFV